VTLPVLHAVTNDEVVRRPDFLDRARAVMEAVGSRGAVQLRAPRTPGSILYELASQLAAHQASTGAWLIVNDRIDVARAVGARAVQLTGQSMTVEDAKRIADSLELGVSVHDVSEALVAHLAGVRWGVVSRVLDSTGAPSAYADGGLALVREVARVELPVVVIGGVVPQHVAPLRRMGVYGIAAIRGVWDSDDAARAASDYLSHYE
jgi:thiamine-phosphate diphosphorylase